MMWGASGPDGSPACRPPSSPPHHPRCRFSWAVSAFAAAAGRMPPAASGGAAEAVGRMPRTCPQGVPREEVQGPAIRGRRKMEVDSPAGLGVFPGPRPFLSVRLELLAKNTEAPAPAAVPGVSSLPKSTSGSPGVTGGGRGRGGPPGEPPGREIWGVRRRRPARKKKRTLYPGGRLGARGEGAEVLPRPAPGRPAAPRGRPGPAEVDFPAPSRKAPGS